MYLAEGSFCNRVLNFSLHKNERDTHAKKIQTILKEKLNLNSKIFDKIGTNGIQVYNCSTILGNFLNYYLE